MEKGLRVEVSLKREIITINYGADNVSFPFAISEELQAELRRALDAIVLWNAVNKD
jgi:hypothetical protein